MQTRNNFSNSVIFNANYLVKPNNLLTHTHTHSNGLSLSTKAIAVRPGVGVGLPFQASARSFQSSLQMLFACV